MGLKLLAVSGGIDSMVMLDLMTRRFPNVEWLVVSIDHGTRASSVTDAEFVRRVAMERYGLDCTVASLDLGEGVSEAEARAGRYGAFEKCAGVGLGRAGLSGGKLGREGLSGEKPGERRDGEKLDGGWGGSERTGGWSEGRRAGERSEIYIAQHLDDLVESIAINCLRGTGWRGLAVMNRGARGSERCLKGSMRAGDNVRSEGANAPERGAVGGLKYIRPFLDMEFLPDLAPVDKRWIYRYAAENNIVWREDPTNSEENYLRNRIRPMMADLGEEQKMRLYKLWLGQKEIAGEIDGILAGLPRELEREWLNSLDESVVDELLRGCLLRAGISTTRLQRADFLRAIREYPAGKRFNLPGDRLVKIGRTICF